MPFKLHIEIYFQGYYHYYNYWYRKKRSLQEENSTDTTLTMSPDQSEQNSSDTKIHEYYEYMPKKNNQPPNLMTQAEPKSNLFLLSPPTNIPRRRKPRPTVTPTPPPREAGEAFDLADDRFFFDQLEKTRPPKLNSDEAEILPPRNPMPRKEVGFVHKDDKKKNEKQYDYETYDDNNEENGDSAIDQEEDDANDSNQDKIPSEHTRIEMNNRNKNMKQQQLGNDDTLTLNIDGTTVLCKEKPTYTPHEDVEPLDADQTSEEGPKRKYRIKQKKNDTKNFFTREQLYAEIDRILQQKKRNRDKKDDFYELRIHRPKYS